MAATATPPTAGADGTGGAAATTPTPVPAAVAALKQKERAEDSTDEELMQRRRTDAKVPMTLAEMGLMEIYRMLLSKGAKPARQIGRDGMLLHMTAAGNAMEIS